MRWAWRAVAMAAGMGARPSAESRISAADCASWVLPAGQAQICARAKPPPPYFLSKRCSGALSAAGIIGAQLRQHEGGAHRRAMGGAAGQPGQEECRDQGENAARAEG
jgi:hypothetical protein